MNVPPPTWLLLYYSFNTEIQRGPLIQIHISEHDGVPIYLQIVNQVKLLVSSGRLQPNEELPSIRSLAEQLLINPNTVARAYRELEVAGVVTKRRTTGSFISAAQMPVSPHERIQIIVPRVDSLLVEAKQLGMSVEEVIGVIHEREERLEEGAPVR